MKSKGLKLTFVNVGYGEAIIIEGDDGFVMVIDGGSNDPAEFMEKGSGRIRFNDYLKEKGIDHIDVLVCTHIHEDHVSGLVPVIERITPDSFWQYLPVDFHQGKGHVTDIKATLTSEKKFLQAIDDFLDITSSLAQRGTEIRQVWGPMTMRDGIITIVGPTKEQEEQLEQMLSSIWTSPEKERFFHKADGTMNNYSIMLVIEYAGRKIFLPGDTNRDGYPENLPLEHTDIFKIGHHGQRDAITLPLLRRIHPSMMVCCASSDRRYKSADPSLLAMAQSEGTSLYFSDCPEVPCLSSAIPPHKALVFTISPKGEMDVHYE